MSKLAELLQSRGLVAATCATSATHKTESSESSKSSRGVQAELSFTADLERRIRTMGRRWRYTDAELTEVMDLARADPEKWARAVALDERREGHFRAAGRLPSDA